MTQTAADFSSFRPRVLHSAFHVEDIDRATAFYVGVLGMREQLRFELPNGEWECVLSFVGSDGKPTGSGVILMWSPGASKPIGHAETGYSRLVVNVSDLDAAVGLLEQRNVAIVMPPTDAPFNMRFAMCKDPDGYVIELLQLGR